MFFCLPRRLWSADPPVNMTAIPLSGSTFATRRVVGACLARTAAVAWRFGVPLGRAPVTPLTSRAPALGRTRRPAARSCGCDTCGRAGAGSPSRRSRPGAGIRCDRRRLLPAHTGRTRGWRRGTLFGAAASLSRSPAGCWFRAPLAVDGTQPRQREPFRVGCPQSRPERTRINPLPLGLPSGQRSSPTSAAVTVYDWRAPRERDPTLSSRDRTERLLSPPPSSGPRSSRYSVAGPHGSSISNAAWGNHRSPPSTAASPTHRLIVLPPMLRSGSSPRCLLVTERLPPGPSHDVPHRALAGWRFEGRRAPLDPPVEARLVTPHVVARRRTLSAWAPARPSHPYASRFSVPTSVPPTQPGVRTRWDRHGDE